MQQFMNEEYDWKFATEPQPLAGNTSLIWNRGKGVGGSSAMNLLIWSRPQREDFDGMSMFSASNVLYSRSSAIEKVGNPGWNWERFYEYSKRTERFTSPITRGSSGYQDLYRSDSVGLHGPIPISFSRTYSGAEFPFQKALEKLGIPTINDSLSGDTCGTYKAVSDIDPKTGTRGYATVGYLLPVIDRPNLKVLAEAYVVKIVTFRQGDELIASNVEFEHGGTLHKVHAVKEVIVSAGSIKSPQILELSGIGDRTILEPLGIPVQKHLPAVGTNVQDHAIHTGFMLELREDANIVNTDLLQNPDFQSKLRESYTDMAGPLSICLTGVTFLPVQTFSDKAASIIQQQGAKIRKEAASYPPGLKEQYDVQMEILKDPKVPDMEIVIFPFSVVPGKNPGKPYMMILPSIAHPFSRGTIHVKSADPKEPPAIDPHYFEHEADLDILVEAFKFTRKVTQTEPFKSITVAEEIPGPNVTSEDQVRDHVRKHISTTWHTASSCSMLPEDKGGVVDTKLKVYGTKNLRVVDLSILPLLVAVHTQATVYGIAEMGMFAMTARPSVSKPFPNCSC
ncbi:hypothetical protein AcV5_006805 [Taiwanofungus camphoratus]|nr:hypothetical protein AcV5_006805 [Antrodia cinnamomea]